MDYNDPMDTIRNIINEDVVNPKSVEDPKLYQDAEGGHAKIGTEELPTTVKDKKNKKSVAGKVKGQSDATVPAGKPAPIEGTDEPAPLGEHLSALFEGEDLSEDFQNKVITIFEAAINERAMEVEELLREEHAQILSEHLEQLTENLTEKLDEYLSYVVEEWINDNELAIESGIRNEISENFIQGLKSLFDASYIDIPDEKYDVMSDIAESAETLEEALNEELIKNAELCRENLEYRCSEILINSCDDLADTEVEKLAVLAEGIEFEDEEQYAEKINILKESYFGVDYNSTEAVLHEDIINDETKNLVEEGSAMGQYIDTITRTSK